MNRLRLTELTSHMASYVAVVATLFVVSVVPAAEVNPVSAAIIAEVGLLPWAAGTPVAVAGLFAALRWVRRRTPANDRVQARHFGAFVTLALAADALTNGYAIATHARTWSVNWQTLVLEAGAVALLAVVLVVRPDPRVLVDELLSAGRGVTSRLSKMEKVRPVALVLILVISGPVGGLAGSFSAVDKASAADGDLDWEVDLNAHSSGSSVVVTPDMVYTAGYDGSNYYWVAINRTDGSEIWNTSTGGAGIEATPFLKDGTLYTSSGGNAVALDAADGSVIWNKSLTSDGYGTIHGIAYDESSGNLAYAESGTGLYAVNPDDGSVDWSKTASKGSNQEPVISNGTVYYVMRTNELISRDMSDGSLKWKATGFSSTPQSPALASEKHNRVFVGTGSANEMRAYHMSNGSLDWTNPSGHYVRSSGSLKDGILVYMDSGDELIGVHAKNGSEIWSKTGNNVEDSSVTIVGDVAYVGTDSGVSKFNINDGSQLSPSYGSNGVIDTPVVGGGNLYTVDQGAKVKKFDLSNSETGNGLRSELMVDGMTRGFGLHSYTSVLGVSVSGNAVSAEGNSIDGVNVELRQSGSVVQSTASSSDGSYTFSGVSDGDYTIRASADGYKNSSKSITVAGSPKTVDLTLYESGTFKREFQLDERAQQTYPPSMSTATIYRFDRAIEFPLPGGTTFKAGPGDWNKVATKDVNAYGEAYARLGNGEPYRVEVVATSGDRSTRWESLGWIANKSAADPFLISVGSSTDASTPTGTATSPTGTPITPVGGDGGGPGDPPCDPFDRDNDGDLMSCPDGDSGDGPGPTVTYTSDDGFGPRVAGECILADGTSGVLVEYWDPSYETTSLTFNISHENSSYAGERDFDTALGYGTWCVADAVTGNASDAADGALSGNYTQNGTAFNYTDPLQQSSVFGGPIGGGGGVGETSTSQQVVGIGLTAGVGYLLARRFTDFRISTALAGAVSRARSLVGGGS